MLCLGLSYEGDTVSQSRQAFEARVPASQCYAARGVPSQLRSIPTRKSPCFLASLSRNDRHIPTSRGGCDTWACWAFAVDRMYLVWAFACLYMRTLHPKYGDLYVRTSVIRAFSSSSSSRSSLTSHHRNRDSCRLRAATSGVISYTNLQID